MLGGNQEYMISKPKSLHIKSEDKVFSKLLSKEKPNSKGGESSFRVLYYGGNSSAIPFLWESQPGTPKHPHSLCTLPPLTPPPSYNFNKPTHRIPKSKFTFNIFRRRFFLKNNYVQPKTFSSASTSSSRSSGSCSSYSDKIKPFVRLPRCFSGSAMKTLCFSGRSSGYKEAKGKHSRLNKKFPF